MISDRLASNFIIELLAYSLVNRTTFEVVKQYLKFSYLQREEEKKFVQWLFRNFDKTGRIATIGQLQQAFIKDDNVLELLADIGDVEVDDTSNGHDSILSTFQEYLRQMMFLDSNDKIADAYNRGDKDRAYQLFVKLADELGKFSILDASFEPVFEGFEKRMSQRKSTDFSYRFKVATMIDELDYILGGSNGGVESGEYGLIIGDSGSGKSQALIHLGIAASRQGYRTAHFQLEGTKEQCLNRYDAAWTGTMYHDMKQGEVDDKKMKVLKKIIAKMKKTDIYIDACEEWGGKSLADVRKALKELVKKHGKIDVIIIDYLELLEVGDGIRYTPGEERYRREKLSRGMKSLAMEFNAVVWTATQCNDLSLEERNDPAFVISRHNINEAKNVIRPTDIFISLNCTNEESSEQLMRIYVDKAREHKGRQIIRIANNFKYARFIDRQRTAEIALEDEEE